MVRVPGNRSSFTCTRVKPRRTIGKESAQEKGVLDTPSTPIRLPVCDDFWPTTSRWYPTACTCASCAAPLMSAVSAITRRWRRTRRTLPWRREETRLVRYVQRTHPVVQQRGNGVVVRCPRSLPATELEGPRARLRQLHRVARGVLAVQKTLPARQPPLLRSGTDWLDQASERLPAQGRLDTFLQPQVARQTSRARCASTSTWPTCVAITFIGPQSRSANRALGCVEDLNVRTMSNSAAGTLGYRGKNARTNPGPRKAIFN
ncbi:hypothetical protein OKW49_008322 [Paraburkholderia youngii]